MTGIKLLGENFKPTKKKANATVFSIDEENRQEQLLRIKQELTSALNNYTETINNNTLGKVEEEIMKKEKFEELLVKYNITESDVTFEYVELDDLYLKLSLKNILVKVMVMKSLPRMMIIMKMIHKMIIIRMITLVMIILIMINRLNLILFSYL